jgi:ribose transport system substrate-binding protein
VEKKKILAGAVSVIVLAIVIASIVIYRSRETEITMAVIVKSTSSAFWQDFMNGLQAGTAEYNIDYYCEAPDSEENSSGQLALIKNAIDNDVDVLVVSAISASDASSLIEEAKSKGIYVVIVDSGVDTSKIDVQISTDNVEAGRKLAQEVINIDKEKKYVGIINFDADAANGQEREQGFTDELDGVDNVSIVDSVNVASNVSESKAATKKMLAEHPEINVVVTLNEWTTLGVGYAMEEIPDAENIYVYGFDSNTLCLDMLEKGYIDGLMVQNPYAMGYLAMENAYKLCKNKNVSEKLIYTGAELITRDNMYDTDMQKIIFPIKN